jgi:hypothetical protein
MMSETAGASPALVPMILAAVTAKLIADALSTWVVLLRVFQAPFNCQLVDSLISAPNKSCPACRCACDVCNAPAQRHQTTSALLTGPCCTQSHGPPVVNQVDRAYLSNPPKRPTIHKTTPRSCVYDWQIEHAGLQFLEDLALLSPQELTKLLGTEVGAHNSQRFPDLLICKPRARHQIFAMISQSLAALAWGATGLLPPGCHRWMSPVPH